MVGFIQSFSSWTKLLLIYGYPHLVFQPTWWPRSERHFTLAQNGSPWGLQHQRILLPRKDQHQAPDHAPAWRTQQLLESVGRRTHGRFQISLVDCILESLQRDACAFIGDEAINLLPDGVPADFRLQTFVTIQYIGVPDILFSMSNLHRQSQALSAYIRCKWCKHGRTIRPSHHQTDLQRDPGPHRPTLPWTSSNMVSALKPSGLRSHTIELCGLKPCLLAIISVFSGVSAMVQLEFQSCLDRFHFDRRNPWSVCLLLWYKSVCFLCQNGREGPHQLVGYGGHVIYIIATNGGISTFPAKNAKRRYPSIQGPRLRVSKLVSSTSKSAKTVLSERIYTPIDKP